MRGNKKVRFAVVLALMFLLGIVLIGGRGCADKGDEDRDHPAEAGEDTMQTVKEPAVSRPVSSGQYKNDGPLSWAAPSGKVFSVGIAQDLDDHIYLNIRCSAADNGNEIGYYIKSDRGLLEYSEEDTVLADCDAGKNEEVVNFYIPRRFYNAVASMEYVDAERYGLRWSDDGSDGNIGGTTIHVRAVNLKTAEFLGVFDIVIAHDAKKKEYFMQSINSADVREYGFLEEEDREEAIQLALTFASDTMFPGDDWQEAARAGAVIQKVDRTYFARFLNTEKKTDTFMNHWTCKDTFAVTFPVSYYGYGTVYLAPQTECIGLTEAKLYGSDNWDLQVYGYDPINPRDEETVVAPTDFFSN